MRITSFINISAFREIKSERAQYLDIHVNPLVGNTYHYY